MLRRRFSLRSFILGVTCCAGCLPFALVGIIIVSSIGGAIFGEVGALLGDHSPLTIEQMTGTYSLRLRDQDAVRELIVLNRDRTFQETLRLPKQGPRHYSGKWSTLDGDWASPPQVVLDGDLFEIDEVGRSYPPYASGQGTYNVYRFFGRVTKFDPGEKAGIEYRRDSD